MKVPQPGELWSDEVAWATTRKPRLLLVTTTEDGVVRGKPVSGNGSGLHGVPIEDFNHTWSWQGYWSEKHKTLPRLTPPYEHHPLAGIAKAAHARKLHGSADVINSIIPSLAPSDVQGYDRDRQPVNTAQLNKPVSSILSGTAYLRLDFRPSLLRSQATMGNRPPQLLHLWYQRQQGAWWLVRTLVIQSPHLSQDLTR